MRKIISILITLGLILGLVVVATPTSAHFICVDEAEADISVDPNCACSEAAVNVSVNFSASITQGLTNICVEFPEGTTVPDEFDDGDILVGYGDLSKTCEVFGDEVTVDGNTVCFIAPCDLETDGAHGGILIQFTLDAGLENPCVPSWKDYFVWTDRAPDAEPVWGEAKIIPERSTYTYNFDFSPTYPGVAFGFVPPFRACGQNGSARANWTPEYDTTFVDMFDGFVTNFTMWFMPAVVGCQAPCDEAHLWLEVVNIPDQEIVHLVLNSTVYNLTICNITDDVGEFDITTDIDLGDFTLGANTPLFWDGALHFSSPGKDYEIGFYYTCPKTSCNPEGTVGKSQVFKVYQDKEAYKLTLCEKWNLISLPLVPLVDPPTVEEYLASINDPFLQAVLVGGYGIGYAAYGSLFAQMMIGGMWYYDAFDPDPLTAWKHWAPGATDNTLTELEDGKAYWMYVDYPMGELYDELLFEQAGASAGLGLDACCDQLVWWIWGTEKPVPPAAPSQYLVNTGWNMVGFTSVFNMLAKDYLWNWVTGMSGMPEPVIYGYTDGCWNVQTWQLIDFTTGALVPGEGYFMAFPHAGTIFVP